MMLHNHAKARQNKIIKTAWSGLFAKAVTIVVSLLMVPLSVHYLGKEQYGLWVAISSMIALMGFMDGGAGNAVINMVAHASGANSGELPKIVSTAFFSMMALVLIGSLLFLAVSPFVPWGKLLGVTELLSRNDLNVVVKIVGMFFFVSMFTTLVGKIQRGLQEGDLDNFWSAFGAVLSLLFVYLSIEKNAGLVGFVIAFLAGPILAYLANNIHYLFVLRRDLRPRLVNVESTIAKEIFVVGGTFFVLQITGGIQAQADNVIIANMLGSAAVSSYSICMKLFVSFSMLFGLAMTPLWPAYRESVASGDVLWVEQTFFRTIKWALLISVPLAIILVFFGPVIIEVWTDKSNVPSQGLLVGCAMWMVLLFVGNALAVFLNAMQLIKMQVIVAVSTAILNISLSIWLIKLVGTEGAVYGSVVSFFVCALVPYSIFFYRYFNKEKFKAAKQRSKELLMFIHVPKTAGNTMMSVLSQNYQFKKITTYYPQTRIGSYPNVAASRSDWVIQNLGNISKSDVIFGHFAYGLHDFFRDEREISYAIMLRHPVDRVLSYYYFARKYSKHYLHKQACSMCLIDFVNSGFCVEVNNGQTRLLAGWYAIDKENVDETDYATAEAHLNSMLVVGVQEMFDESILNMKIKLGWSTCFYTSRNVGEKRREVDGLALERILELNQYDLRLYDIAIERLLNDISEHRGFEERLRTMRELNVVIGKLGAPVWLSLEKMAVRGLTTPMRRYPVF